MLCFVSVEGASTISKTVKKRLLDQQVQIGNLKGQLCLVQIRGSSTATSSTSSNLSFLNIFLVEKCTNWQKSEF